MSTQSTDGFFSTNGYLKPRRYYVFPNGGNKNGEDKIAQATAQEPSLMNGNLLPPTIPSMPPSLQAHLRSGLELFTQGETLDALWAFFEGVGTEPRNALGHYLCGLAFQSLELGQEAQAAWETVLTLTSGEEVASGRTRAEASGETLLDSDSDSEIRWVRSMAERLVGNGPMSPYEEAVNFADFPSVKPEAANTKTNRQVKLEASILADVHQFGSCYVKDRHIASRLEVTTEEQVVGWKQSFAAREGLECHPYQKTASQSSRHEGVIFMRSALSTT